MRLLFASLAIAFGAGIPLHAAEEAHLIKIKANPSPGMTVDVEEKEKDIGGGIRVTLADETVREIKTTSAEAAYRKTVLEADKDGTPTKYLKYYTTKRKTEDGKPVIAGYEKRTALYERKDGKFRVGISGSGALRNSDSDKLLDNPGQPDETTTILTQLNSRTFRIGETQDLPPEPFGKVTNAVRYDTSKAKLSAKLIEVSLADKSKIGVFEIKGAFPVLGLGKSALFDQPVKLEFTNRLRVAIDGSSTEYEEKMKLSVTGKTEGTQGDQKLKFDFGISVEQKGTRTAERDESKFREIPKVTWLGEVVWAEFKPASGSFQAKFPGLPDERKIPAGKSMRTVVWMAATDNQKVSYGVIRAEIMEGKQFLDPKNVLEDFRARAPEGSTIKDIKEAGVPGIEITGEVTNKKLVMIRHEKIFCTPFGVMWQVMTVAEKPLAAKVETKQFFDSFKILEKTIKDD
ncbi:hypothetical protein [Zavarzinella formosa]|uniref:hypothetical protein n=1 Tax=Zavarzinella formosa TaxID=360055 RepID=UPI00031AA11C|nr:hypothetical protein [Zavarzinella formosa]